MKKIFFYCAALSAMLSFSGCSDDFTYDTQDGEGRVLLRTVISTDMEVKSRAGETTDELAQSAIIWISNPKGVVRKYTGIDNVPAAGINLVSDNYVAEVWAGDSVPASFDSRQFKGLERFTVSKGSTSQVEIVCTIANSVVEVQYAEGIEELISDPVVTVGHKAGSLTYTGFEDGFKPGYFMMPTFDKNLAYTLTAKDAATGNEVKLEGVIENAKPATKYILNVKHNAGEPEEFGGALINIEVDQTEIVKEENIEIYAAPVISGTNFDIASAIVGEEFKLTEKKVWIQSTTALKSVVVSSPSFTSLLNIGGDDFDILAMSETVKQQLANLGFSYQHFTHTDDANIEEAERNFEEMKLTFSDSFMNLFPNGEHQITITASDASRTSSATINLIVSDAKVLTVAVANDAPTTWATSATFVGTVLKDGISGVGFNYREIGEQQWQTVLCDNVPATGSNYSVVVSGLNPATTYEYQAISDGFASSTMTLTTESATQLPNSGFEEWSMDGKVQMITADTSNLFWDSGNHGSSTMSKNVTQPDTEYKHSGEYSAKLESQFVGYGFIGKFAAGNLFVGKYLKTDGTDGVLGWGRQFTSRPKALKGYVRYEPGVVDNYDSSIPSDYGIVEGQNDIGQIFIAILDDTKVTEEGEQWPIVIKTKTKQLFNKNASNVIAYGELLLTEATAGNGMVEFNIPIEYYNSDLKASNIAIVCSASRGGDYFTGGPSKMWVDDFELVY